MKEVIEELTAIFQNKTLDSKEVGFFGWVMCYYHTTVKKFNKIDIIQVFSLSQIFLIIKRGKKKMPTTKNTLITLVAAATLFLAQPTAAQELQFEKAPWHENPLRAALTDLPIFVDIDNDGDLDAFLNTYNNKYSDSQVLFFKNTGSGSQPRFEEQAGQDNPLADVNVNYNSPLTLVDIDNDRDLDAFIGSDDGTVHFYQSTGSASQPRFEEQVQDNPLADVNVGGYAFPTLVDIDNDRDLDAFIGSGAGTFHFYQNTGSVS